MFSLNITQSEGLVFFFFEIVSSEYEKRLSVSNNIHFSGALQTYWQYTSEQKLQISGENTKEKYSSGLNVHASFDL